MNFLWGSMILTGILYGAFHGTMQEIGDAVLASSKEAVALCITMTGVMALWTGLMKIAEESGMVAGLTQKLAPFVRFMFPNIPENHPAREHISMNIIANVLGLGWAATPAGLKAMESLAELEEERRQANVGARMQGAEAKHQTFEEKLGIERQKRYPGGQSAGQTGRKSGRPRYIPHIKAMPGGVASNEMCTFLILNISSLQLIPVNVIAYRAQYGSVNPTAIVGPGIAATAVSTGVAVVFCKMMDKRKRRA
ncbi:MAG: nucleoside recognition protein [Eubacteriales bacterium]|nr:nucleoside recognition protein [Eubacteriales bacterium]